METLIIITLVYLAGVYFAVRVLWYTDGREMIAMALLSWIIPLIGLFFMRNDERNGLRKSFFLPEKNYYSSDSNFKRAIMMAFGLKDDD